MKMSFRITSALLCLILLVGALSGCELFDGSSEGGNQKPVITSLDIIGSETRSMKVGDACLLEILQAEVRITDIAWTTEGDAVQVDEYGIVLAVKPGVATVTASYDQFYDTVEFTVVGEQEPDEEEGDGTEEDAGNKGEDTGNKEDDGITSDPYVNVKKSDFYENYTPATSFMDAYYRTRHNLLSGVLEVPGQAPTVAADRPKENGLYVRNTNMRYEDNGNTYVVFDANGNVAFKIYRGAAYITLEEVAAYMFAFDGEDGAFPANYTSSKKTSPANSPWGEYLRVNHSHFLGDTERYPREPKLPNITGCGGDLQYWEMDIGANSYNNGNKISRGACRLVYGRNDLDGDGVYEKEELHVFYTYNHYDDFQEYLNYKGGWGEMFGYQTNGASATKGPSPYVEVVFRALNAKEPRVLLYLVPSKQRLCAA